MILCIYHKDSDGRMAGAVVAKKFPYAVFLPMNYGDILPEYVWSVKEGDTIIIVDYSLTRDQHEVLLNSGCELIWCDHHKSAVDKLAGLREVDGIRSERACGAWLTWEHFFPEVPVPLAIQWVDSYDTGKGLFGAKPFWLNSYIRTLEIEPNSPMLLGLLADMPSGDQSYHEVAIIGRAIYNGEKKTQEVELSRSFVVTWNGNKVRVLNTTRGAYGMEKFRAEDEPAGVIAYVRWFQSGDGKYTFSAYPVPWDRTIDLRSRFNLSGHAPPVSACGGIFDDLKLKNGEITVGNRII